MKRDASSLRDAIVSAVQKDHDCPGGCSKVFGVGQMTKEERKTALHGAKVRFPGLAKIQTNLRYRNFLPPRGMTYAPLWGSRSMRLRQQ